MQNKICLIVKRHQYIEILHLSKVEYIVHFEGKLLSDVRQQIFEVDSCFVKIKLDSVHFRIKSYSAQLPSIFGLELD